MVEVVMQSVGWQGSFCGLCYKCFTIIIYYRNDSGLYYETMIMIVSYAPNFPLALASIINYDRNWYHHVKRHLLMIVMCLTTNVGIIYYYLLKLDYFRILVKNFYIKNGIAYKHALHNGNWVCIVRSFQSRFTKLDHFTTKTISSNALKRSSLRRVEAYPNWPNVSEKNR